VCFADQTDLLLLMKYLASGGVAHHLANLSRSHGVHHYDLVSDPGTHNYKECLVSVLWCWEVGSGMHCPFQNVKPGKVLTPNDVDMDEDLARFAARQKLERVASWRQLQGYSHQLFGVTRYSRPRVTLKSFEMPPDFHVRPVGANEGRKTVRGELQDVSYIVDKVTGVRTPILPAEPIKLKLLTLGLDQGSIGSAGAGFGMFFLHLMLMARFDKIHRLIRDLVASENGCCRKIFRKAKLWSAYIYSLNKRPFGSGANTTLKQRWMEIFHEQCDIDSAVVRKHLPRIARGWNMPYGTREEKQAVFDKVLNLPSFKQHLSHPKVSNWFAWNKSAHEQIPEFYASRMVLESQLPQQTDPVA